MEIVETMMGKMIKFMCIQETKWMWAKAKELDTSYFKLWYTGRVKSRNGVGIIIEGIIIDKYWKNDIVYLKRIGDMIMALKFLAERDTFNVMIAYTPQLGL